MSLVVPRNFRRGLETPMRGRLRRRHLLIRALATLAIGLSFWQRPCAAQLVCQADFKHPPKAESFWTRVLRPPWHIQTRLWLPMGPTAAEKAQLTTSTSKPVGPTPEQEPTRKSADSSAA